jgi:hypothetical protein
MIRRESQNGSQRIPTTLSAKLNKGLVAYVAAASAAGVGVFAWVQPADAEIVYTPANTPILINTPVPLDLNNDGTVDFELSNNYRAGLAKSCTVCSFFEHASMKETPAQAGNAAWAITSSVRTHGESAARKRKKANTKEDVAAPVFWGVVVGGERKLDTTALAMDSINAFQTIFGFYSTMSVGLWGKGNPIAGNYLGLKFTVGGEVHYGWARIVVHADGLTIKATLTGYAYETVPNRGIITGFTQGTLDGTAKMNSPALDQATAPDSASLGRLAQGATGLSAWRATQTVAQNAQPAPRQ